MPTINPTDNTTGLKALIVVMRQFGLDWSLERLSHMYAEESELNPERLSEVAKKENLKCEVLNSTWDELQIFKNATPVIASLKNGAYVVVLPSANIEDNEDHVSVFNPRVPAQGEINLPKSEFLEHWTGVILIVKPNSKAFEVSNRFGLRWFIPEFIRQQNLFGNVVLAAIAMHVLALAVPIFFQLVIDKVLIYHSISTLTILSFGVVAAIFCDSLLNWLRGYFVIRASSRIDIRLAKKTFAKLMSLPIDFFEHLPAGIINKHMQQGSQIREFLTGKLMATLLDMPALIIFLPLLFYYSPTLTSIVIGVTILLGLIIGVMIGPYRRRLRSLYETEAKKQSLLVECIHGIRTIKTMNLESRRQEVWEERSAHAISNYIRVGKIALSANTISQFIERGLTVTIVIVGSFLVFGHHMTVGELVAFNMLSYRVISPILQFIGMLNNYQEVLMSVEMLGVVMNRDPEQSVERGLTPEIKGEVTFENMSFRYPGTTRPALQNITATLPAGSVIGIVGRSGSGKTTLSALIQGLYVPSDGAVCIDGHNIQDLDLSFFRGQIGVVSQDPFIFRGSIKDNIRMGRPGATFEEVVIAARSAGADEFISLLGQRYDTELEESGSNLSGGQKQRLCIARVLLRDPRIIIFDEATSALDPESETIVIRNLRKISEGRTTIIISHRLVTIRNADAIIVVEAGSVSDMGTHDELIARNAFYRLIWSQQTGALS